MTRQTPPLVFFGLLFALAACSGGDSDSGSGGGGGGATPTPTATPEVPGGGGTCVICNGGQAGLCGAGDVARVDLDLGSKARFPLQVPGVTCPSAKDNRREEYTLILYNTTAGEMSFRIDSPIEAAPISSTSLNVLNRGAVEEARLEPPKSSHSYRVGVSETDNQAAQLRTADRLMGVQKTPFASQRAVFRSQALVEDDEVEFRVRNDPANPDSFTTTSGILRAQGDHINIFVDRDHPVGSQNADAITTTALDRIVTIFEENIYPLEETLLGSPSDVDGDGRVWVLITPVLNRDIQNESYVDNRNLLAFDPIANPISNEAEVIYIFAPDSLGNYKNSGNGISANEYVSKTLNAWIAFQFSKIINFNQHVLVNEGNPEDDWISDGIGAVMADLAGFNIFRGAAAFFLAAPQIDDIRGAEDLESRINEGAEYMFMLYYLQSQVDSIAEDANGDGFDDDLAILGTLMNQTETSITGLETAAAITFDPTVETEFQALFKDWTIAIATSGTNRTDLQVAGQTAVKYYLNLNPTDYGSGIGDASGSNRIGADGGSLDFDEGGFPSSVPNAVGTDLNLYHSEERRLIENGDEHVWAPGNSFFGFIDPFSAMYVRLAGMFQETQTVSLLGSSASLKGFLVRRTDIDYPHVYSESIFGSIDQHAEDLNAPGPNPYWGVPGVGKKIDYLKLVQSDTTQGQVTQDFLSIIGRIDPASTIDTCDAAGDCVASEVPDTDKYQLTIPDELGRVDEGEIEIAVRRQFKNGADTTTLTPMLAVVSSKDVPYPYVPHPIRSTVAPETRQQYRWMASQIPCGDDDDTDETTSSQNCVAPTDITIPRLAFTGFVESTGNIDLFSGASWNGDIEGSSALAVEDCNVTPNLVAFPPLAAEPAGYGNFPGLFYPVTTIETSPSSLGAYSWSGSFMTESYSSQFWPDVLFAREFLKPVSGYPSEDPLALYDPRNENSLSNNCHALIVSAPGINLSADSPDDFLTPAELNQPATLAEQILNEMARSRLDTGGNYEGDLLTSGVLDAQYEDNDVFAIDGDSRDADTECTQNDRGNNMNTFTVRGGEGSLLMAGCTTASGSVFSDCNFLEPHIRNQLSNSAVPFSVDPSQAVYVNGSVTYLTLSPGRNYTIIVGGTGGSVGSYELRIRKINTGRISGTVTSVIGTAPTCEYEL